MALRRLHVEAPHNSLSGGLPHQQTPLYWPPQVQMGPVGLFCSSVFGFIEEKNTFSL